MTRYGRSPWTDNFPKSRVPSYPRFRGHRTTDVVVVGGGLTGCATAYAFAAAGIKVVLLEAEQIGRGNSGGSSGWISDDPGVHFIDVERALGLRATRRAWQAWRRAALDFMALVRRLNLKCDFESRGTVIIASTPEETARLKREHRARREAGLNVSLMNARSVTGEVAIPASAALRSPSGATLDPYRAALGLAAAAAERGADLFERSPVRRTTFTRKSAVVHIAGGTIRANRVVIATGVPTRLFKSLQRHFWFKSSFLALTAPVPAKIRQHLGARRVVVRDSAVPPHVVRWLDEVRLLVIGADGDTAPPRQREKTLIQRTGQLMYELSTVYPAISGIQPEYGWDAAYARTAEGLPYIGPHRNYPHHLFAFGDASHSLTGAYLASRIFLRQHLDEAEPVDEVFAFTR
jgi:glycine/D-amino acid oxidase-like deaminating enzyme